MKTLKKISALLIAVAIFASFCCIPTFAAEDNTEAELPCFVVLDENGNEIKTIEGYYDEEIAAEYEQLLMRRWTPPYFYNLSSSNFTDSFSSLAIYRPDYKFYPNSANRIYYYARANETSGYAPKFSLYNVTTQSYIATYNLDKASGNTYEINGYVPGLSGSQYYTISLSCGSTNMTNGYVVVSWSSI